MAGHEKAQAYRQAGQPKALVRPRLLASPGEQAHGPVGQGGVHGAQQQKHSPRREPQDRPPEARGGIGPLGEIVSQSEQVGRMQQGTGRAEIGAPEYLDKPVGFGLPGNGDVGGQGLGLGQGLVDLVLDLVGVVLEFLEGLARAGEFLIDEVGVFPAGVLFPYLAQGGVLLLGARDDVAHVLQRAAGGGHGLVEFR